MSTRPRRLRSRQWQPLLWMPPLLMALASSVAAHTFPGANGDILFGRFLATRQLHLMGPDGSDQRNLSNNANQDHSGQFSAGGSRIVFVRIQSFTPLDTDIYVMDADGTGEINLTATPGSTESSPSWSPDGTRIAFTSNRDAPGTFDTDIYVMDAGGGSVVRLTSSANNFDPEWSPDGQRIAFTSTRDGVQEIYVMDDQGNGQMNLTMSPGAADFGANWSPDGTQITFVSDRDGIFDVFVMSDDGTGQTNLTVDPGSRDLTPTFSPDGTRIAFAKAPPMGLADVYVMNSDGTGMTQLTSAPEGESVNSWKPLTPDQAIGGLSDDVQDLVDAGSLNNGQGTSLIVKLNQALSLIGKAKVQEAINVLQDFITQVSDLVTDGVLTSGEGAPLIDAANSLITHLSS